MKEVSAKPDVSETGNKQGRIEFPRGRFDDPNKPCTNIGHIVPTPGGLGNKIYDTNGKYVTTFNIQRFGNIVGKGSDFVLCRVDNSSGKPTFFTRDTKGNKIAEKNFDNVGKFAGSSGENMTFEKANMYYTYDKNFKQVGSPIQKPRS